MQRYNCVRRYRTLQSLNNGFIQRGVRFLSMECIDTEVSNVVIGGGVLGSSMLYHLTKAGMSDSILLEKGNLTCGTTWHAAGLVTYFHPGSGLRKIHNYSVNLYKELENETGKDVSFQTPGSIRLIENNNDRIDEAKFQMSKSKLYDNPQYLISPKEIEELHPLINVNMDGNDSIWGGIYTPEDGHIDPTSLTNAFVAGAKLYGGKIFQNTPVNKLECMSNGKWKVYTSNGDKYIADRIINCAGLWGEYVGKLAGVYHPVGIIEHQYIITETIKEVNEYWKLNGKQLPVLRSLSGSYYIRQERDGLLIGPYESQNNMKLVDEWNRLSHNEISGTPLSFGTELFQGDLDRLETHLLHCAELIPQFGTVGIQSIINGPVSWPPDGNPLLGPVYNDKIKNYWAACGMSYGIAHAGGAAKYLVDWILNGEAPMELFECDPTRYGEWTTKQFTCAKIRETYGMNNNISYPKEERLAGRPIRTNSLYHMFKHEKGCVFGFHNGLEQPLYFNNFDNEYKPSFRRTNWFDNVKNEVLTTQKSLGVMDMSTFSKFIIYGKDAFEFLDTLVANKPPIKIGKVCIAHMLTKTGKVTAELTITKLSENEYYIVTGSDMERHDLRQWYMHKDNMELNDVCFKNVSNEWSVLSIAGPNSENILSEMTYGFDVSMDNFKFFNHLCMDLGTEIYGSIPNVNVLRLSFTGLKGFEFHLPNEYLYTLYENIYKIAEKNKYEICDFGAYALDSMRMEIGFKFLGSDMRRDDTAVMCGLKKFIKLKNRSFIGKYICENELKNGTERYLVKIVIDTNQFNADGYGDNPIFDKKTNKLVGWTTSGSYSHQSDRSLAFAYLYNGYHNNNEHDLYVEIVGEKRPLHVITDSLLI
eukprot:17180_1